MNIDTVIDHLEELEKFDVEHPDNREALRAAIALLRTHPDNQPNEPLTLESLRGMEGQPVWVTHKDGSGGRWGIVNTYPSGICADVCSGQAYWFEDYVGTIAYRRPPKEA